MSAILTPAAVEQKLVWLSQALDAATKEIAELDEQAVRAKLDYEVAHARAFLSAEGSIDARRATAVLSVRDDKLVADLADVAVRARKERLRTLSLQVEITRSLSASVRSSMAAV